MKILLVGEFSLGSLGSSYSEAFKKLKYEVFEFDLTKEFNLVNPFNKYLNRLVGYLYYRVINKILLEKINIIKPELTVIIKGACLFPATLKEIKSQHESLLFCFNPDNPFNTFIGASNDFIRHSIPFYDCYFIWGNFLIPKLIEVGAKKVEYLPFAYDPELHYPVNLSVEDKTIYESDIAFIGSYDKEREQFLMNLTDYDLAIWGNGWNKLPLFSPLRKKWKGRDAIGKDFSKVCNASKIILNHVREQNGNAHNMKTFEIPACRGFMLTKRTKEQCELFEENKEIGCFETPDELIDKLERYLPDKQLRENASLAAYNKVKENTYEERVQVILDIFTRFEDEVIVTKN